MNPVNVHLLDLTCGMVYYLATKNLLEFISGIKSHFFRPEKVKGEQKRGIKN